MDSFDGIDKAGPPPAALHSSPLHSPITDDQPYPSPLPFPELVRPTPLYHRAYRATHHPQRTHPNLPSIHQPSLYDNSIATFSVPNDLSPWAGSLHLNGAIESPGSLYSEQALAPPPPSIKQEEFAQQLELAASAINMNANHPHPYLQISPVYILQQQQQQQAQQPIRSFSTHVFQRPPSNSELTPSTPLSNASGSGSPSPASASSHMHTFAVTPQQPMPMRPPTLNHNHSHSHNTAGDGRDPSSWDLVPYTPGRTAVVKVHLLRRTLDLPSKDKGINLR